jgi:hypothetical protein
VKKIFSLLFLLLIFSCSENNSKWTKVPRYNGDTQYLNIKDAVEIGPGQFKIQEVISKSNEKKDYLKKIIKTLVPYCGTKDGKYSAISKDLFLEKELPDLEVEKISVMSSARFGYTVVSWSVPYSKFRDFPLIACETNLLKKNFGKNEYSKITEKKIISANIEKLDEETVSDSYYDCRRKMYGVFLGKNEPIFWRPMHPTSLAAKSLTVVCDKLKY